MRLIDADLLNSVLDRNFGGIGGAAVLAQLVDAQPTIADKPNWTPCAEGCMPEDDTNFCAWMQLEATIELNGRYSTRTVGRFYVPLVGIWVWADGWTSYPTETGITADKADIGKVVAWRYPSPYNPDRKED